MYDLPQFINRNSYSRDLLSNYTSHTVHGQKKNKEFDMNLHCMM